MDLPPPDLDKLLAAWDEWERGEVSPGTVMKNLKVAGMSDLLRRLVDERDAAG